MMATRERRERRFKTYPSSRTTGKVHRYLWDSLNMVWYVPCCGLGADPHGEPIDIPIDVTCLRCK